MRAIIVALAALAASPAEAQGFSGLEADVITGFVSSVVEGCATAAEARTTIEQLGSPLFVRDPNRLPGFEAAPGSVQWAPRIAQGPVSLDDGAEYCDVVTHGIPVTRTIDEAAAALEARGYERRRASPAEPGTYEINLAKKMKGRAVVVTLSGDEAGPVSRYSILSAVISVAVY